jgi:Type II secretory pathway, ATPase PulE/Tfp pilus assembly pathway, ATPase PilB
MTAVQGSSRFTGFIRRLVDEGHLSAEKMQTALQNSKKAHQDIVPHLIQEYQLSARLIAETISIEFGEPVFDISTYDTSLIIRDEFEDKLITKHRILPIFKHGNLLFVAISNPTNIEAVDAIRFGSKLNTETIIVEHDKLEKLIEQNFAEESTFDFDDDFDLDLDSETPDPSQEDEDEATGDEAPIVKYINKLLVDAFAWVHLTYISNPTKRPIASATVSMAC